MAQPIEIDPGGGGGGEYPPPTPAPPAGGDGTPTPTPPPSPPPPPSPSPPPPPSQTVLVVPIVPDGDFDLQEVPLEALPAQTLAVTLGEQPCVIDVYQRSTGLFVDLQIGGQYIVRGALAVDREVIVRDAYRGFTGDLVFVDTQGETDPFYTGLGARWQFFWLNVT